MRQGRTSLTQLARVLMPTVTERGRGEQVGSPSEARARPVSVRVHYEANDQGGALCFWEAYAISDNQVLQKGCSSTYVLESNSKRVVVK
jgi:hypothetical protein